MTCAQAITYIGETLHVAAGDHIGLYLPCEKRWLDDNALLKDIEGLQDVEEIEFKDKNAREDPPPAKEPAENNARSRCYIL